MKKDRILIKKANIPYRFSIALPRETFDLEIRYNQTADMFTTALYKNNNLICIEPILYGIPLFRQLYQPGNYPPLVIIPKDSSGENTAVTWDNFNETVFLEIDNAGD
ncbi:MAG: hypothetical protein Q4G33_03975 [bacterium]|nr:hypothetical protein [bacterium]